MPNSFDRHPYLKTSTAAPFVPAHKHVGDEGKPGQIVVGVPTPKKLTFDKYFHGTWASADWAHYYEVMEEVWRIAQENV